MVLGRVFRAIDKLGSMTKEQFTKHIKIRFRRCRGLPSGECGGSPLLCAVVCCNLYLCMNNGGSSVLVWGRVTFWDYFPCYATEILTYGRPVQLATRYVRVEVPSLHYAALEAI